MVRRKLTLLNREPSAGVRLVEKIGTKWTHDSSLVSKHYFRILNWDDRLGG